MDYKQAISRWALFRRNEMPDLPNHLEIHPDFLRDISKEEFDKTFRYLWNLFYRIFTDISENPQCIGVPHAELEIMLTGAEAGKASNHVFLLDMLFNIGELNDNRMIVKAEDFRKHNKLKNTHIIFSLLHNYGFCFDGLNNGKVTPKTQELVISYPDDQYVIKVLYLVARKARGIRNCNYYIFRQWHYRLLMDGLNTYNYNDIYISLYDLLHSDADREFLEEINKSLLMYGYKTENYPGRGAWHISYFKNSTKEPYLFGVWLNSDFKLYVSLRIRNAENCLPYLENCSERIKDMFRTSKYGCGNPNCRAVVRYKYEDKEIQKCGGCCGTAFEIDQNIQDIQDYIKLVELGYKK